MPVQGSREMRCFHNPWQWPTRKNCSEWRRWRAGGPGRRGQRYGPWWWKEAARQSSRDAGEDLLDDVPDMTEHLLVEVGYMPREVWQDG